MNADKYKQNMEVGKIVAKSIKDGGIPQDSLSNEHKEALDLYWNKKELLSIENVVLKSWQGSFLQYSKPSDREIIWVPYPTLLYPTIKGNLE